MGELQSEDFGPFPREQLEKCTDLISPTDVDEFEDCSSFFQDEDDEKEKEIEKTLETQDNSSLLREFCFTRGGLLKDALRRKAWPSIVGVKLSETSINESQEVIESHKYYSQVVLDVKRILKRFPPGIDEVVQADLQVKVTQLIVRVLIKNNELHYYQGFHDVAITLLLVLGEEMSLAVLDCLANSHFNLYMESNMEPAMEVLNLIYVLIKKINPKLYDHLMRAELGTICFLPWVITWFGHVIDDYDTVVRLFDVFISSHKFTPIYLSTVIVLYRAEEIFLKPCDMPIIHQMLSQIPDDLPLDNLIIETERMMEMFPPDSMDLAIKEFHLENLLRIHQEEEERRKRITARKNFTMNKNQNPVSMWYFRWLGLRRPLKSSTVKYVALSLSVATVAWIYNYIRPNLEGFA